MSSKKQPARKNPAAVALGKRGKGRRKTLTPAALEQRRQASLKALAKRLAKDDEHFQRPPGPLDGPGIAACGGGDRGGLGR